MSESIPRLVGPVVFDQLGRWVAVRCPPPEFPAGLGFFMTMVGAAFAFVSLAGMASALGAFASSLPRGIGEAVRILVVLLQAFDAIWFIILAVIEWRLFAKAAAVEATRSLLP
jgi:hypothetical protein